MLGREHLLSRDEVVRLQGLRGHVRHRRARAHLRRRRPGGRRCRVPVLPAPDAPGARGERLVPDTNVGPAARFARSATTAKFG